MLKNQILILTLGAFHASLLMIVSSSGCSSGIPNVLICHLYVINFGF